MLLALLATTVSTVTTIDPGDDTIIVDATRLGQTRAEAGTPITVIDRETLERLGYPFALDAVATAPGVTVNRTGALGGQASVRIRGAASDQTLVLIDGVPAGDPSAPGGGFDFARLDTAQIEKIEILRGAQSTLWGSEAIGGVVSITTRTPEDGIGGFLEAGSFDTIRGGASAALSSSDHAIRIAASAASSDGFSKADENAGNTEDDGYRSQALSARYSGRIGGWGLDARLVGQSAETEFDSFDATAPGFIADGDDRAETDELTAHLSLASDPDDKKVVRQRVVAGYRSIDRRNFAGGSPAFDSEGERTTLRYEAAIHPEDAPWTFLFGAERDGRESPDGATHILSGFALAAWKPVDGLTITSGARVDDHARLGSETTGRIALAYEVSPQLLLRANWGEGFKAPSLFQQTYFCCGATSPNTDLRPERSEGFDIGAELRLGDGRFEVGYFELDTEDLIDFSFALGAYENIAEAETRGIELSAEQSLPSGFSMSASYTWLEAEDGSGAPLARLPEHAGTASLGWERGRFGAALFARYNGEEQDSFGAVEAWTRLDATVRLQMTDRVELYARGENLTDTDYQEVFGYGTAGLSGTLGIRLR